MTYALFCRTIAIPTLILFAARASIRERLLQAAALSGADPWRIRARVTLPLALPGVAAAAAAAFVLSLGEIGATSIVNAPGWETLPMRIGSLLHVGDHATIAAICLVLSALVTVPAALVFFFRPSDSSTA
jgi:ABC-type spermidine/putrescine transport system permease subunit II